MTNENIPAVKEEFPKESLVPWSLREALWGLAAIIGLSVGVILIAYRWPDAVNLVMALYELIYLVPALFVLALKRAKPETIGLRRFAPGDLAVGYGLLVGVYAFIMAHNLILIGLGVAPQGEYLTELFGAEGNGFGTLVFVGVAIAPIVEEIFFRGFLFAGFREKFGWKTAAALSAAVFGLAHMQPAALLPTFVMGVMLAYLYQRSKSIWPGIILHFTVNAFTFIVLYAVSFMDALQF